jgi:hypothetical protein
MKIRTKIEGAMLLLMTLVAAGMLLLLTVAAVRGQGAEPPPATPPAAQPAPPLSPPVGGMKGGSAEAGYVTRRAEPYSWRPVTFSAAVPVLVIMDSYPWGSAAIQYILDAYGIPYDQVNSSDIPAIDLSPYAVVIIPSVQGSGYYNTYNSNLTKFEAYVAAGGVLELHGATQVDETPYPAPPGGVVNNYAEESYNYVEEPTHPLVVGVPNPMSGGWASHNYFTNTYTGTTVICTRGSTPGGEPTLIEYPYGSGLVIASGQTLEYGYRNNQDAGIILHNMIPYAYSRATGGFVTLTPDQIGGGPFGAVVSYTLTLHNYTGISDTFDLTATGNGWSTIFWDGGQITNTGPVSDEGSMEFTVQVAIPPSALPGDVDTAIIQATSAASPTVHFDTATITTTAVCSPALVFSGQSARRVGLYDAYEYGGQRFTHVYLNAHTTSGGDSMNAAVQAYHPVLGTWQTLREWRSVGPDQLLINQFDIPPIYSGVRVQLNDTSGYQAYYDYRFILCREPAVDLGPPSQGALAQAGRTATYTQTVTNYMMASDSFDLTATSNSWPTTFWDGPTQINNTGPLADLETFTFTVKVELPASASVGDFDQATIRARSVASPAVSDTGSLRTAVLAYPWVQAFREQWAPDGSADWEQYLGIVRSSGIVAAQVTDDWYGQYTPPAVAAYPRDAIVAAWTGPYQWNGTAYYYNIEYAALDTDGRTVISVTQVSDNISVTVHTFDGYPAPAVAPTNGNVLIAWYRYEEVPDSLYNIYYAMRSPAGTEVLPPTALTTNTTSTVRDYYDVSAAAFGDGCFAVAWQHYENGIYDIYYAVLDSAGGLITGPVNLTHNTGYADYDPRANRLADGNVLLTWYGYHGSGSEIYYAVLDSAGDVTHPVTRLTDVPYDAYYPDAVGLRSGDTVVAWQQDGYYPNRGLQMAYAVLDSTYTATVATQILTNTLSNDNCCVSLARDGADNAVLTWRDSNMDRIYYALVDHSGGVRTIPMVFRTARSSRLDISSWGAASGSLPPARVYLPLVVRNRTPGR